MFCKGLWSCAVLVPALNGRFLHILLSCLRASLPCRRCLHAEGLLC